MNQGQVGGSLQHEDDEGDCVQPGEDARQSLVVPRQPPAARHPGEASFHNPAARQKDEAALCLGGTVNLGRDRLPAGGKAATGSV